ncbi:MAG: hypothetical protein WEC75_08920 [Dehalococcoidia bacterium]
MKKIIVGALGVVVAVLGFGSLNAPTTQAVPDNVYAIGCEYLIGAIDGDTTDTSTPLGADGAAACNGISSTGDNALSTVVETGGESETLETTLGDDDGTWEAGELDDVEFDANQMEDGAAVLPGGLYLFVLVDDDDAITIDPKGLGADLTDCAVDFGGDEDCDADGTLADGAVIAPIGDATGVGGAVEDGDTVDVDVTQEGVDVSIPINIVGPPDEITITALKTVVETLSSSTSCDDVAVVDALDENDDVDKVALIATVVDSNDTDLARVSVAWESDDTDVLDVAQDELSDSPPSVDSTTGVSVDSDGTIVAAAVFCGQDDPGTATVTASFTEAEEEEDSVEITVVGPAASVALTASPAAIACDGTGTSTVTATVTDSDGNNVADGSGVNFSVVALGTSNPINVDTADGTASSVITPLSGATAGVTVVVSAGDAQASIRIDCLPELQTPAAPASPTPGTGIGGPDTGNGGYLGQDSTSGFPMWTLAALALASMVMFAGGLVARRAGK